MKLKIVIPVAAFFVVLIFSCKNDLKILAPYKESLSVYGLLNPNQATQYIRINKIFLGAGDATVMAQNKDSVNFGPNVLSVALERYMDGSTTPTTTTQGNSKTRIILTETVVTTSSGAFNNTQRLYVTSDKLYPEGNYKLIITNTGSGKTFTAKSTVIDSVKPGAIKPFIYGASQPVHPFPISTPQSAYIDYSITTVLQKIKFKSIINARLYDVVMRFHYKNVMLDNSTTDQYVDYTFPTVKSVGLDGDEDLEVSFQASDFYSNVANAINGSPAVANLKNRTVDYMEYFIYAGSQDLSDFLQVNAPSTTIAQDKPYYTNINGGVGIFASRSKSSLTKDLANVFIDEIAVNHYTCPLSFANSSGSTGGACQ